MKRKFNFKPLSMLLAALVIADHFESEKQAFVAEEPLRDDPFIANFREAVNLVMNEYYGINTKEELQKQTSLIGELAEKALTDLGMIKTQIERDFRADAKRCQTILAKLGFKAYWSKSANGNQSMLIGLLLEFRNNLDETLRAELEQNGVNAVRLDNIVSYSDSLTQANITQEGLKGSTKLDTEEAVSAMNDIYDRAMDICAIGQQLFKKDKLKKDLFVFSRLVKALGTTGPGTSNSETSGDAGTTPVASPVR